MAEQSLLSVQHSSAVQRLSTSESPWRRAWRRFRRHKLAMVGVLFLGVLILAALAAPIVAGRDPLAMNPRQAMAAPSADHWLGTDLAGRDIWARLIYGSRVSLAVGLVAVSISLAITLILGTLAGY